ncbi:MAG: 16S rRNA (guanine(966)-N(2))-methyltransferase RsmD [bacterium]
MRIIGGQWRGLRLTEVGLGDPRARLRPTSDRVREAIFNLLINGGYGDPVGGARVLDLFGGTGALGLEALSRGAATLTLVDDGAAARGLIAKNIALCRAEARHLRLDATRLPPNPDLPYDLIFLDPPYGKSLGEAALLAALAGSWLRPEALVVWEEGAALPPPPQFDQLDQRRYGDTFVTMLRAP